MRRRQFLKGVAAAIGAAATSSLIVPSGVHSATETPKPGANPVSVFFSDNAHAGIDMGKGRSWTKEMVFISTPKGPDYLSDLYRESSRLHEKVLSGYKIGLDDLAVHESPNTTDTVAWELFMERVREKTEKRYWDYLIFPTYPIMTKRAQILWNAENF